MKWSVITRSFLYVSLACIIEGSGVKALRVQGAGDGPLEAVPLLKDPFGPGLEDPFEVTQDPFDPGSEDPFEISQDPFEVPKDPFEKDPFEKDTSKNGQDSQVPQKSCMRSVGALYLEQMTLSSLRLCCHQDKVAHESLMKDFKSIVDSAFNLLEQYCSKGI